MEFEKARHAMVEGQVRTNDVTDHRLQDAMRAVPRERFVPKPKAALAYIDEPLEIAEGRFLTDPRSFAKLAQAAEIEADEEVLVIGAGYGYAAAVLGALAAVVVAVESDEAMAKAAGPLLAELDIDNAAVVSGPLREGYRDQAPYDVIFIDGGVESLPEGLADQLKEGGRIAAIMLEGPIGKARVFTKAGGSLSGRTMFDATVPVLPGFEAERGFVF